MCWSLVLRLIGGVTATSNLEVHIGASWSDHVTYDSMPGIILNKRQL